MGQDGSVAALVAVGPILVMVGIGVGIYAIEQDSASMVFGGLGIAAAGLLLTVVAFVALRLQASQDAQNPGDDGGAGS